MENNFFIKHIESIVSIVAMITTCTFWIFTMNGLPARVAKLENEVELLKNQLSKNDTKTDIIMDDVKFIKQVTLHSKRGEL